MPAGAAPLIEFAGVSKVYPGAAEPAVDRLDLTIARGEFLSLLGPSGSGKTTTLMMLAGFESVSAGTIRLDGQPIESLPAHKRNLGVVFQSYSLFPHMTVAGNVAFPLRMRGVPAGEIDLKVRAALARVRLEAFAARRPNQLSGGQQQRVALARALVFEPSVVLMDEPLAALDKKLREEMQLEIRRLHRELGVTMVYVTHDQGEAMSLSDRVAVFNHGRIEQLGAPAELYDRPSGAFVAGFVGDNNAVAGRVAGRTGDGRLVHLSVLGREGTVAARCSDALAAELNLTPAPARAVCLSVRPERLRVLDVHSAGGAGPNAAYAAYAADAAEADDRLNRWPASVVDLVHQGDHWRLVAQIAGADNAPPWLVKLPAGAAPAGLVAGSAVTLGFAPDDAWVF
ncbi:MAG: ABC transporter ATP-binding protein [Betaproteobacteria bacterium]|nr:ABC transporter ATP-binding protein [Betaproteobacteria bacterium]MCC6247298.1 ABC transporter ATP-binding protein [Rubrivivax sp.]